MSRPRYRQRRHSQLLRPGVDDRELSAFGRSSFKVTCALSSRAHSRTHILPARDISQIPGEVGYAYLQEALHGVLSVKRLTSYGFYSVVQHQVRGREQGALGVRGIVGEVCSLRERNI